MLPLSDSGLGHVEARGKAPLVSEAEWELFLQQVCQNNLGATGSSTTAQFTFPLPPQVPPVVHPQSAKPTPIATANPLPEMPRIISLENPLPTPTLVATADPISLETPLPSPPPNPIISSAPSQTPPAPVDKSTSPSEDEEEPILA